MQQFKFAPMSEAAPGWLSRSAMPVCSSWCGLSGECQTYCSRSVARCEMDTTICAGTQMARGLLVIC